MSKHSLLLVLIGMSIAITPSCIEQGTHTNDPSKPKPIAKQVALKEDSFSIISGGEEINNVEQTILSNNLIITRIMSFPSSIELKKDRNVHLIHVDDIVLHLNQQNGQAGEEPDHDAIVGVDDIVLHLVDSADLSLVFSEGATDTKEVQITETDEADPFTQSNTPAHRFIIDDSFIFFDYHLLRILGFRISDADSESTSDDPDSAAEPKLEKGIWEFSIDDIESLVIASSDAVDNKKELRVYLQVVADQ